ncbi:MAG: hypothetical protein J6W82_01630 [Bacteroidales bacterium]|nr:hypothetical protein [Bacteroidales bacterium]
MTKKLYNSPVVIRMMALTEENFLSTANAEGENMTGITDPGSEELGW